MKYRLNSLILAATFGGNLFAQSFTATVRGIVTDSSGAGIPGAKVTVTEADRAVPHPVTTDEAGRYVVTALPPGGYTLTVEAQGFKKHSQGNFTLAVQQQATLDVQLQVGDMATTVQVEGSAPLLNTTISTLGQVIDNKYMISLPNIARDSLSLVYLTPGVVGSAGRRGDNSTNFVANGSRNSTSDVMVDGVTVTTVEQNSGITDLKYKPSVDAVQEFKMQVNFFSAEYGQTGGAVVNMVTKSGTNDFHGTAFYFLRDASMNANDWFANRAGQARPPYQRHQYGGVIGGPVIKNKTFFFATYERTEEQSQATRTQTFPTLLQRQGNFTETRSSNGTMIQVYNPFSTTTAANGTVTRAPFAGNVIPASMMDPIALKAAAFFPEPNQVTNAVTNTNNWFGQGTSQNTGQKMDFKGDHNFTDRSRITGRYSFAPSNGTPPNLFGEGNPAVPFLVGPSRTRTHSTVADFTRTQSATTVWTLRYGLVYSDFSRVPAVNYTPTSLGLPSYIETNATHKVFPRFAAEGFSDIGTEGYWVMDRQEAVHQVSGSVSKTVGGHNMKFGGEMRQFILDYNQPGFPSGRFAFGAQTTRADLNQGSAVQGNGFASMLLGFGNGSDYHIEPKAFSRSRYAGFYFQDDWKITRSLTLNLGLRYEFDIPRWEAQNRYSYWDLEAQSPVRVQGYDTRGVYKFNDNDIRSPFDGDYNNFSPRVGFAWAVNNKTAIRAGAGMLYSLSRATVFGRPGAGFTTNSPVIWTRDSGATRAATLANPYPNGLTFPPGSSLGDATFIGLPAGTIHRENVNPEYYSWNFSIQRELGWQSVLEINYTGSRGAHLLIADTGLSYLDPSLWSLGRTFLQGQTANPFLGQITDSRSQLSTPTVQRFRILRPMPHFDGASRSEPNRGDSNYHALQMKYEKRFSNGFTGLAHYTWSKMIDNSSVSSGNVTWLGGTTSMQNRFDYRQERSLSVHDIPHRLVVSGAWQLPFGRGKAIAGSVNRLTDILIGGWEVSGFLTMQAGIPLQVTQDGGQLWDANQRPHLVGDPSTTGRVQDRLNRYFNEAAFQRPAIDTYGSAPRYLGYRGPGIKTLDAALLKSVTVREGQRAEFRLEMQNATNTPMFSDPANMSFGSTSFGQITSTRIGARNVQLGFKYYF
ncbi:MAG: carboxypeptidase regulatory-like domain-containing protein [Bryobacteraceae bacterium]|nr:carboxypeptidase regulatory-like domain-containing protein [Bryobacteraceae bacterium]